MADYIVMPKLGFDMREGVLASWLKEVGDAVNKGDVVAEIESDKATLELESQVSGTLLQRLANEGDVVPVGGNLAVIGKEGEAVSENGAGKKEEREKEKGKEKEKEVTAEAKAEGRPAAPEPAKAEPAPAEAEAAPAAPPKPESDGKAKAAVSDEFPGGGRATPVARRVAREHDVDLRQIDGSGPEGRVRKADVEAYLEQRKEEPAAAPAPTPIPAEGDVTEVPSSKLRQAIGRRMVESKTTMPHFYVTTEVDMEPALALRQQINGVLPEEQKVSVNDMIVKAAALTLREFPNLNASFGGDKLIRHNRINVGSAVAVEGGLLTVVQKDTDKSPLAKVAADNKTMIARVRSGKLHPDDIADSTFTVSNLGPWDIENFIAIINPPEAAILAVSTARQVPVVVNGELRVGTRMKATISADHRVTDGAEAARFVQRFKQILEEPLRLLL